MNKCFEVIKSRF